LLVRLQVVSNLTCNVFDGYDVYLTCSEKLTGSQLSLPHEINKKIKRETENKLMSVIGFIIPQR